MKNAILGFFLGIISTIGYLHYFGKPVFRQQVENSPGKSANISLPSPDLRPITDLPLPYAQMAPFEGAKRGIDLSEAAKALAKVESNTGKVPDSSSFAEQLQLLERDTERKLGRLWDRQMPRGQLTSRSEKSDGSIVEMEQTEKGDVISRQFKDGIPLAMEWRTVEGKFLIRTYNPDGSEKGISVGHAQDAIYTVIKDLQDRPTYKEYTTKNGTKYIARYEKGRTTEQWYVTRDGRYVRID